MIKDDLSIIFISMEACASSMIMPIISQVHECFTGKRIYWHCEISRLLAIDNDRVFPKGFSSVFYVNPKHVLQRPFDKVILIQRPKEEIRADIYARLGLEPIEEVDKKIDFYYNLIYEQEIEDERLYRIWLPDHSKYPVALFSDLLDWIGYPKKYRPMIVPFPIFHYPEDMEYKAAIPAIYRDFRKYSTIQEKWHEEGKVEKEEYTQMVNVDQYLIYKHTPEEYNYQEGHTYRVIRKHGVPIDTLEVLGWV